MGEDNRREISTLGDEMNEESVKYALVGLRCHIKSSGVKQHVFAEGVTTPEHLSKILNFKAGASAEMIRRLAQKAGLEPTDLVLLGKRHEERGTGGEPHPSPSPSGTIPGVEAGHVLPMEVLSAVTTMVHQYLKADDRLHWWKAVFESLPVAALIVSGDTVIYQNQMSRIWGSIAGRPICEGCISAAGCDKDTCPITVATETNDHASGYRMIGAQRYRVDATPMRHKDEARLIVTATEAPYENHIEGERRSGVGDRRE